MAVRFHSTSVTLVLLCVLGSQALDLLRVTSTSGDAPSTAAVKCWCPSYPNLTVCSWPEPSQSAPMHYIATYSERSQQANSTSCSLIKADSPSSDSEQLWRCHLPNMKLLTDYIVNVTAVSSGKSSSHLTSFMLEDIVKPDPPVDVRVFPHSIRNLSVEWSPPPTWASLDIFPLKYQIVYKWENRGNPHSVKVGPFESTRAKLKGLLPGRAYQFQVCAKELLDLGHCSAWSAPVKVTIPKTKP